MQYASVNCRQKVFVFDQYYSILPISLNITYSVLLNIPNPQNCAFPIQYVSIFPNITKPFPIFINLNIPQYYLDNLEVESLSSSKGHLEH